MHRPLPDAPRGGSPGAIVESEGFLERIGPGGVHVSLSTVAPETSRRMAARHAERGGAYVEATVFGRLEAAVTLFPAPIYRTYGRAIADTVGASRIPLKDVGLLREAARRVDAPTPIADRLLEMLERQTRGG